MSKNVETVQRLIQRFNTMDGDGLSEVLDPEVRHTCPGSDFGSDRRGREVIINYFKNDVFPAFDRVGFEVKNLYEDPRQSVVIVEWRSHLLPKTGKEYGNDGVFVIELQDGRITWIREYFDTEKAHENVN